MNKYYSNLDKAFKKYGISKGGISTKLKFSHQKLLRDRIVGKTEFKPNEISIIKKEFQKKGLNSNQLNNLFKYEMVENIQHINSSGLGILIDKKLKELNMSKTTFANQLGANKNTISNWIKGGKVQQKFILDIAEILGLSTYQISSMNDNNGLVYVNKDYNNLLIAQDRIENEIYKLIIEYQYSRGYDGLTLRLNEKEIKEIKSKIHLFLKDQIENYINEKHPLPTKTKEKKIRDDISIDLRKTIDTIDNYKKRIENLDEKSETDKHEIEYYQNQIELLYPKFNEQQALYYKKLKETSKVMTLNNPKLLKELEDKQNKLLKKGTKNENNKNK